MSQVGQGSRRGLFVSFNKFGFVSSLNINISPGSKNKALVWYYKCRIKTLTNPFCKDAIKGKLDGMNEETRCQDIPRS